MKSCKIFVASASYPRIALAMPGGMRGWVRGIQTISARRPCCGSEVGAVVYSCRVAFPREDHHRLGVNPEQIVVAAMLPPIPWQQCCEVIVLVIGRGHRFPLKAVAVIAPADLSKVLSDQPSASCRALFPLHCSGASTCDPLRSFFSALGGSRPRSPTDVGRPTAAASSLESFDNSPTGFLFGKRRNLRTEMMVTCGNKWRRL